MIVHRCSLIWKVEVTCKQLFRQFFFFFVLVDLFDFLSLRNFTDITATELNETSYRFRYLQDTFVFIQPSSINGTVLEWKFTAPIVSCHNLTFQELLKLVEKSAIVLNCLCR